MSFLYFFSTMFSAIALENMHFCRAADAPGIYDTIRSPRRILALTAVVTAVCSVSAIPAYFVNGLIHPLPYFSYIAPLCFLLCNLLVYGAGYLILSKRFPALLERLGGPDLPFSAVNCVTLGTLYLAATMSESYLFSHFFGYCVGSGLGFGLALLLFWLLRQRITFSQVPRAFRGLPITMIYLGLVSLALYGLVGSQLPA